MKLLISLLFVLSYVQGNADVCSKYGIKGSVLDVSLEWVMQGYSIGFQGFFVELLGFAGSISKLLPQSRLVKSSFKHSFDESLFFHEDAFLRKELFAEEAVSVSALTSLVQDKAVTKPPNANSFGSSALFCGNSAGFEKNYVYAGAELAKGKLYDVADASTCCEHCYNNPLCLAWSFDSNGVCTLQGRMDQSGYTKAGSMSGRMTYNHRVDTVQPDGSTTTTVQPRRRNPAPSVIVYHGTTCIHRNYSASAQNRDINTILIGRYMLERPYLVGGYNLDEYAVLHCAARMDELWVPTEWHKALFLHLLTQQGSAASVRITVIPEAVDTTLFDPAFVRTGASRSIVGPDRMLLVDGSRVNTSIASPDTLVVQKECVFANNRIVCNDHHRFEFLSVFKWEYRKGWDIMLDAYWAAFGPEDDVVLRVRSYLPLTSRGDRNITRQIETHAQSTLGVPLSKLARVVWENDVEGFTTSKKPQQGASTSDEQTAADDSFEEPTVKATQSHAQQETHLTREDMRDLLASANAFVLATRGEGWGLPVAEAMAMALPVIVTNHSGPAAFATNENAYLIPILPELDDLSFVKPDAEVLANLFRQVVYESSAVGEFRAQQKGRAARDTMKEISPDSIVCKMNERIRFHAERRGWIFP